ncbi:MAG: hypothetical protein HKN31_03965 [Pricia sp.]|nr:hypothetical protein [Pricia sp.]
MALFISICYLANPLHNEITTIFHEVAHIFELPESTLSHSDITNQSITDHHYHEHTYKVENHEHQLIALLNSIFDASDKDNPSDDSLLVDISYDKHVSYPSYFSKKIISIKSKSNYFQTEQTIIAGHLEVLKEPPKQFSS